MEIKLTLSIEEVNGIIATLAMLPFNQVHDLVNKVRNQAIEQVQLAEYAAQQAAKETAADTADKDDE